ncbi:MAG: SRPBCC domain-containing protein [Flavobacteriales bacterium]
MNKEAIFNFIIEKDELSITVERSFNAPLDRVWAAWTEADILCQWWAPRPYRCVIKQLDFREGGRCLYCMEGPEGDRHWCFFDYEEIRPKSFYSGSDAFCDEQGVANDLKPKVRWENNFSEMEGTTLVRIFLHFNSVQDLDKLIEMGFKGGFTMGMNQLDELLAEKAN